MASTDLMPDDDALARASAALERLDRLADIGGLAADLRRHGLKVTPGGEIRAAGLLTRLSRAGVAIASGADAAAWLAPILVAGRNDQDACRRRIAEWWDMRDPAAARRDAAIAEAAREAEAVRADAVRRRNAVRIVIAGLAGAVAAALFYVGLLLLQSVPLDLTGQQRDSDQTTEQEPASPAQVTAVEAYSRIVVGRVLPALILFLPFGAGTWALLTLRRRGTGTLRREFGTGALYQSVQVPPVETALFRGAAASTAARALKRYTLREGRGLDTTASIRDTVRAGGFPHVRRALRRISHEYVVIVERGGADDHVALIADALCARLAAEDVAFVRYDAHGHFRHLRHVAGRRHGRPVESLAEVAGRHMGARLIVVGPGDAFFDPHGGGLSDAPGFAPSGREQRVFGSFEAPVLLSTTAEDRWGDLERSIVAEGVAVFPATTGGLAAAAGYFAARSEELETVAGGDGIPPGEDQLVTLFRRDRARLASDVAPEAAEAARIARLLQAWMGDASGFRLLAAVFAFPQIGLAMTRYLADRIEGRVVDEELAVMLARLPWLRDGRAPDWLRLAVWKALSDDDRARVRDGLRAVVRELGLGEPGARPAAGAPAGQVDVLADPDLRQLALARLGLGPELVTGESLFLRFLDDTDPDGPDQPLGGIRQSLGWPRILGAAALLAAGISAAAGLAGPLAGPLAGLRSWFGGLINTIPATPAGPGIVFTLLVVLLFAYWRMTLNCVARPQEAAGDFPWWYPHGRWLARSRLAEAQLIERIGDLRKEAASLDPLQPARLDAFGAEIGQQQRRLSALRTEIRDRETRALRFDRHFRRLSHLEWPLHAIVLAIGWGAAAGSNGPAYFGLLFAFFAGLFLVLRVFRRLGRAPAAVPETPRGPLPSLRTARFGGLLLAFPLPVVAAAGLLHVDAAMADISRLPVGERTGQLENFAFGRVQFLVALAATAAATFAVLARVAGAGWSDPAGAAVRLAAAFTVHLVGIVFWILMLLAASLVAAALVQATGVTNVAGAIEIIASVFPPLFLVGPIWLLARQLPSYARALGTVQGTILFIVIVVATLRMLGSELEAPGSLLMPGHDGRFTSWPTITVLGTVLFVFAAGAATRHLNFEFAPGTEPPSADPSHTVPPVPS